LAFYDIFSTNRLYHAIEVGNISQTAGGGEHKHHAVKQQKNTINQHNHKLSSAWGLSSQSLGKYWQLSQNNQTEHTATKTNNS